MKAVLGFLETLGKVLKSFEPDFNRLGKIFADFSKQVATAYNKLYDVIQKEVEDLVQLVKQFIESLPKLEDIQSAIKKVSSKGIRFENKKSYSVFIPFDSILAIWMV